MAYMGPAKSRSVLELMIMKSDREMSLIIFADVLAPIDVETCGSDFHIHPGAIHAPQILSPEQISHLLKITHTTLHLFLIRWQRDVYYLRGN